MPLYRGALITDLPVVCMCFLGKDTIDLVVVFVIEESGHSCISSVCGEHSVFTVSQSDLQAVTGRGTSGVHNGKSDEHSKNRARFEQFDSMSGSSFDMAYGHFKS
uniref:Uncharacterized protein n=1 Tax=Glossina palpalis gambiensis TaxID=67801 RepID=A0A1B0ANH4_9MUSC